MDQFSYVIGLLSIITGLALSDIGISLHRLLKRRDQVRWDWLTLAIAAYIGFVLVRYWYQIWSIRYVARVTSLFFFLTIIAENFVLFLTAASCLPDEADLGERVVELRQFQQKNSTYLWRLFLIFSVLWAAHGLYFAGVIKGVSSIKILLIFGIPVLLAAALAFVRRRDVQILLFGALVIHEGWWMIAAGF